MSSLIQALQGITTVGLFNLLILFRGADVCFLGALCQSTVNKVGSSTIQPMHVKKDLVKSLHNRIRGTVCTQDNLWSELDHLVKCSHTEWLSRQLYSQYLCAVHTESRHQQT